MPHRGGTAHDVDEGVRSTYLVQGDLVDSATVHQGLSCGQACHHRGGGCGHRLGQFRRFDAVERLAKRGEAFAVIAGDHQLRRGYALTQHRPHVHADLPTGDRGHGTVDSVDVGASIDQCRQKHVPSRPDPGVHPTDHGCALPLSGPSRSPVADPAPIAARATRAAWTAAPKPLSMLTTTTPAAQELSMVSSAATPPNDAP